MMVADTTGSMHCKITVLLSAGVTVDIPRSLPLPAKSFLVFGPRGVGKSTWLRHVLPEGTTCFRGSSPSTTCIERSAARATTSATGPRSGSSSIIWKPGCGRSARSACACGTTSGTC